jgi:hypothetical protein
MIIKEVLLFPRLHIYIWRKEKLLFACVRQRLLNHGHLFFNFHFHMSHSAAVPPLHIYTNSRILAVARR